MNPRRLAVHLLIGAALAGGLAACSSSEAAPPTVVAAGAEAPGVRVVSPADAQTRIAADPNVVVLDVRTPAEYAEGHLEDAILIDYQSPSFAAEVATLDRDASYVLYCRSGNRSAGARAVMSELGFRDVADVEGGILGWAGAGLPISQG
jgi:phage shock protein E